MNVLRILSQLLVASCVMFANGFLRQVAGETSGTTRDAERPPNVIVFLSDDQGWGDFGFQGNTNFLTPNIDRLANEGTVCNRFYVCPVCAPTRAEFLTGRYHPRGGALGVTQGDERLNLDEITLADRLKQRGYATAVFGKWHNGSQYPYHPNGRGFDEFYGFCSGHWGDYFSPPLERNGVPCRGNGFVSDDFADHAISFIDEHRAKPFFCYVAFNTPHTPMQVPDEFYQRVKHRELRHRHTGRATEKEDEAMTRAAVAMVENIDANVGRILVRLDQLGIAEQTIILYFNDNGPNSHRWNGGMKGRKGSTDEGGVRSPLVVRWPGTVPSARRLEQLCGAIDLLPTVCELTGTPIEAPATGDRALDGISLAPQLLGSEGSVRSRSLFTQWGGKIAMRQDQFLCDASGGLFDLIEDPGQHVDIRDRFPDRYRAMNEAKESWKREVLEPGRVKRPFLVGHPERARTELPAQDGKCSGPSVRRSNTAPNCSYFTGIASSADTIVWEIEVLQPGRYEVIVHYTAPQRAVGMGIACEADGGTIQSPIRNAFTSATYGGEHDWVPRQTESLMKEFTTMSLGKIVLANKVMELRLRLGGDARVASDDKSDGIEIRAVELIRN
ncbi:MAG: arylsulfatase [Planctomycetota bacterium]